MSKFEWNTLMFWVIFIASYQVEDGPFKIVLIFLALFYLIIAFFFLVISNADKQ